MQIVCGDVLITGTFVTNRMPTSHIILLISSLIYHREDRPGYARSGHLSFLLLLFLLYISFLFTIIVTQTAFVTVMMTCYTKCRMLNVDYYG